MTFAEEFVKFADTFPKEYGVPAYYVASVTPDGLGYRYEDENGTVHTIRFRDCLGVPPHPDARYVLVCVSGSRHTIMAPLWPIWR